MQQNRFFLKVQLTPNFFRSYKSSHFPDHYCEKISVIDKILELPQLFKVEPPMSHDRAFVGAGTSLPVTSSKDLCCRFSQSDDREERFGPVSFRHLNGVLLLTAAKFEHTWDMESSDPDSESINESEGSESSFELDFDIEVEDDGDEDEHESQASRCESSDEIMAYADEPLADEDWLKKYEAENEENKRLEEELQKRLDGTVQVKSWWVAGVFTFVRGYCEQTVVFVSLASLIVRITIFRSYSL